VYKRQVVEALVRHIVKTDKSGIRQNNRVYPRYLFTLDADKNLASKLFQLTGKNYVEVTGFTDFAYTGNGRVREMTANPNGYIPAASLLMCPSHSHEPHPNMKYSCNYWWYAKMSPQGNTGWDQYVGGDKPGGTGLQRYSGHHKDTALTPIYKVTQDNRATVQAIGSASWKYPDSIICEENKKVLPLNTVTIDKSDQVTIRYPGRRYRLFKLQELES